MENVEKQGILIIKDPGQKL
jgi:hypothetical protein